eukprot:TRINITY_DN178_c0_g1_i2.p1 TRINITY_DN178_c0_g1~~TRINITY_DN178_c0_g1_i2.p1  ORF type:complete len:981 (+),score=220.02 TRINITY_DN178_c0_g1_i2:668-3610(+)
MPLFVPDSSPLIMSRSLPIHSVAFSSSFRHAFSSSFFRVAFSRQKGKVLSRSSIRLLMQRDVAVQASSIPSCVRRSRHSALRLSKKDRSLPTYSGTSFQSGQGPESACSLTTIWNSRSAELKQKEKSSYVLFYSSAPALSDTKPSKPIARSWVENTRNVSKHKIELERGRDNSNEDATVEHAPEEADKVYTNEKDNMRSANHQLMQDKNISSIDTKGNIEIVKRLARVYEKVTIVETVDDAKNAVNELLGRYRDCVHACDTEVADIDIKKESPVGHGRLICFSIYCEDVSQKGKNCDDDNKEKAKITRSKCVWVDVLDGKEKNGILAEFARYFKDPNIKKVWHNYSFDKHILQNHGIEVNGFHADTMHLARLWNSAKRTEGGYSLESLTKDEGLMENHRDELVSGKVSMKTIFGKKKVKKDGTEGKIITVAPVEQLQRNERELWISYSSLDAISTLKLWKCLVEKLGMKRWKTEVNSNSSSSEQNMNAFYEEYWRPFGELLIEMERIGMQVDRNHLAEIEKIAVKEQEISAQRFRYWAKSYSEDAEYMNVRSDSQVRQLLFGGVVNKSGKDVINKADSNKQLPERIFKVPNVEKIIKDGKKAPTKYRDIRLRCVPYELKVDCYTMSGRPAVSLAALKSLAGKVTVDFENLMNEDENELLDLVGDDHGLTSEGPKVGNKITGSEEEIDESIFGTAYEAFGKGQRGREACYAIAALCEVSAIDTLISNFIRPLQGKEIADPVTGRVHCSLNINTETGRLSARKPSLQNQPALEKDRYKIRQAFVAAPGKSLIVADYGQDVFAAERRKAKMLNFSIAYGKTAIGLSKDWKVTQKEAQQTLELWYRDRKEVQQWQNERINEACTNVPVQTLLGRPRHFPNYDSCNRTQQNHIRRAAINTPVQGSAADVAMCAMLKIWRNERLKALGWHLLLQVHDEVILEGPTESAEEAKSLVVKCMTNPFKNKKLKVDLVVDAKFAPNWYAAK